MIFSKLENSQLHIFSISSDPDNSDAAVKYFPNSVPNYGRVLDPDYGTAVNQYNNVERIVLSISGDLWVYEPDSANSLKNLVQITALSDWNQSDTQIDKIYLPKWSYDNKSIAFVRRPAALPSQVSDADIYVINDVQDIIESALTSGSTLPPTSWADSRIKKISTSSNPEWYPSYSRDSSLISYNLDSNNLFNNKTFVTDPDSALTPTNFDIYKSSSTGLGTPVEIEANSYNEAFIHWAPAGGDLLTYISIDGLGNCNLDMISYPSVKKIGGFRKDSSSEVVLKDNSYSSIKFHANEFKSNESVRFVTPLPFSMPLNKALKPVNTFRIIELASGREDFNYPAELTLFYSDAQVRNINESTLSIFKYIPEQNKWVQITSKVDSKNNLVIANINSTGLYGIFSGSKAPNVSFIERGKFFAFPNPVIYPENEAVRFRSNPTNISIKGFEIYTINGTLIYKRDFIPNETGNKSWGLVNYNGDIVSSGIYIYVITEETGKKHIGKIALIK